MIINILRIKEFENFTLTIYGSEEKPLFRGGEIGRILNINRPRNVIFRMNTDREVHTVKNSSNHQYFVTLNGLSFLVNKYKNPSLQAWISRLLNKEITIMDTPIKSTIQDSLLRLYIHLRDQLYEHEEIMKDKEIQLADIQLQTKRVELEIMKLRVED